MLLYVEPNTIFSLMDSKVQPDMNPHVIAKLCTFYIGCGFQHLHKHSHYLLASSEVNLRSNALPRIHLFLLVLGQNLHSGVVQC